MKATIRVFIICILTCYGLNTQAQILQYALFCMGEPVDIDGRKLKERIVKWEQKSGFHYLEFIFFETCEKGFYPSVGTNSSITFSIDLQEIESIEVHLANGAQHQKLYISEECYCAYEMKLDILGVKPDMESIQIRNKNLHVDSARYKTFPVVYYGDSTSFRDRYGRLQGYSDFPERPDGLRIRNFYKNNETYKAQAIKGGEKIVLEADGFLELLEKIELRKQ